MKLALALLLALVPAASAQTFSQTYTVGTSAPTVLDGGDLDVVEECLPDAETETFAADTYAARVAAAAPARTLAVRRLMETLFRAQSPRYAGSVASVSTVSVTTDAVGDLVSLTMSSASPPDTRTWTVGVGGFSSLEGEVALLHARRAIQAIQATVDVPASQAAHVLRLRAAVRRLLQALAITGKTAYGGPTNGITTVTVVRANGAVVSVTIAGS